MRIIFFGTPDFAVPSLRALTESRHEVVSVVAQPDRPAGRGMKMLRPAVAEEALRRQLPLLQPAKIRTSEFLDQVGALRPDLGVVVAYGRILPGALLTTPPRGFVNVHGSLLPRYRGAAPIQRAIENGDKETGITIMRVDSLLDHGPMLRAVATPIGSDERLPELAERLSVIGSEALVEVVDAMERDEEREVEQEHDQATHAAKIEKHEGVVDWGLDAEAIYSRFRAFFPWPGLSTTFQGETLKLVDLRPTSGSGSPGEVIALSPGLVVAAGRGALHLLSIQRAGRSPVGGSVLARALGLVEGMRLS